MCCWVLLRCVPGLKSETWALWIETGEASSRCLIDRELLKRAGFLEIAALDDGDSRRIDVALERIVDLLRS
jgi:hypothetical protein